MTKHKQQPTATSTVPSPPTIIMIANDYSPWVGYFHGMFFLFINFYALSTDEYLDATNDDDTAGNHPRDIAWRLLGT